MGNERLRLGPVSMSIIIYSSRLSVAVAEGSVSKVKAGRCGRSISI